MTLNGIDIASWQADINVAKLSTTNFVIVKATGGTGYTNEYYKQWADQTLNSKKLLGFYHFAQDSCGGTAKAEADHFVAKVKPYVGKASLYLDWEANALILGPKWAKAWLDRVYAKTGVKPGIYMSKSTCNAYDWSAVKKAGYPLWVAQYPNYNRTGYKKPADIWTDWNPFGAWSKPTIFQYTSCGRIAGYNADLDLDCFYGDAEAWKAMSVKGGVVAKAAATVAATVSTTSTAANKVLVNCAEIAAKIHQRMCDDDGFGYSWEERYGTNTDKVTWVIEGRKYTLKRGDYDCSSSVITAWKMALQGTKYEGRLDGATYTGNMREVFVKSGLFEVWDTSSTYAVRGDVYLNDQNHTAMCQDGGRGDGPYGKDMLSEFCWGDNGAYGNKRGDQSGYGAYVHEFYEYSPGGWSCTLHYNHKADTTAPASSPTQTTAGGEAVAKLNVDGDWGPLTTKEFKRQLGIKVNGKRDGALYKALRAKIGPKAKVGNELKFTKPLKRSLQRKLGVEPDGIIGPITIKALQRALNKGKVAKW